MKRNYSMSVMKQQNQYISIKTSAIKEQIYKKCIGEKVAFE